MFAVCLVAFQALIWMAVSPTTDGNNLFVDRKYGTRPGKMYPLPVLTGLGLLTEVEGLKFPVLSDLVARFPASWGWFLVSLYFLEWKLVCRLALVWVAG